METKRETLYSQKPVSQYIARRTPVPLTVDGDLTKGPWARCERSHRFGDVIDGHPALYDTRAAVLWDDQYLYVGFWCEEPYPNATISQRDGLIWRENDFEVFIDGGDTYYELQVNALNNVYEVLYIWQDAYKRDPRYRAAPEFDLVENDARVFGGNHDRKGFYFWNGSNPRGNRYAFLNWDLPGLRTAVKIDGRLNDWNTVSRGLTIEIAFPWSGMRWLAGGRSLPPAAGDIWRLFLGRYEKLRLNGEQVSVGWAWDEIGTDDNHAPERFTKILFSDETV